jgi:hypothetical protein
MHVIFCTLGLTDVVGVHSSFGVELLMRVCLGCLSLHQRIYTPHILSTRGHIDDG